MPSDGASVAGSSRSSMSRASRASKRGAKKSLPPPPPPEPVEEPKDAFQPSMLSAGLSQLGRTADGLKPAYLTLSLTGTDLANADVLGAFPHLQTLVLRDNRLVELRGLAALRHLTAVDVSGNKLTQVLDLRLPADGASGPTNLRSADFSRNALDMLRDLSPFSRLTSLSAAHNRLERVGEGLTSLTLLKVLDLSHNRLVSVRGLERCANLRELRLGHNALQSLEPLAGLSQLQVLDVSHNRLAQLSGAAGLSSLRTLDVSCNRLGRLEELAVVRGASLLGTLDVRGNPLDKAMCLRLHVVHLLPQVVMLDGVAVESKEKVLAANMHGADADSLRLIRRKYFPNGELDDGGGAIPPLAAGLVASAAEEEAAADGPGPGDGAYVRLDAWAASIKPPYGHHPGYPPPPHMRGGYYPQDARYPAMGPPPPMGHPHYAYGYRPHPGMPPHPAYHYMPPPYGHPHHAIHPGMYPGMQPPHPAAVAPGAPQPPAAAAPSVEGGAPSDASEDAAAMHNGASDGGTDPASAASQPSQALMAVPASAAGADGSAPALAGGKLVGKGSTGGESEGDVGLEAVIRLRSGVCDDPAQEQQQQQQQHAGGQQQTEELEGRPEAAAPSSDDVMAPGPAPSAAPAGEADGGAPKAPPQQAGAMMPPPQWPPVAAPPPPHMMGGPHGYEWPVPPPHHPHMHPHHPGMMPPPGYGPPGVPPPPHAMHPPPPHGLHPSNSWGYPYDPYAAAAMHHQQMMMGGDLGEDANAAAAAGADYAAQQHAAAAANAAQLAARRRPSQNGLPPPGPSATPVPTGPQQRRSSSTFPGKGYPGTSMGSGSAAMAMGLGMDSVLKAAAGEQQRPGSAELPGLGSTPSLQMTRSGSFSQLNQWFGLGDAQCNVSRRTQRLKKRRSTEHSGGGATPDPFLIGLAAERAASGREPSSGGGGMLPFGLPPMFPGSGGTGVSGGGGAFSGGVPPRRSSGGSDRTALLHMGRSGSLPMCIPPNGRQRSDPGYLIEGGPLSGGYDQVAFMGLPGWPPGAGGSSGGGAPPGMGPMAGLGQLVHHPGHPQQHHAMVPHAHVPPGMPAMQPPLSVSQRSSDNGSAGRAVHLPRRFDDAIMTMEYSRAHPGHHYGAPAAQRAAYAHGYEDEEDDGADGDGAGGGGGGKDPDDSDEDYDAAAEYGYRRVYTSYRRPDAEGGEGGAGRKRKAPTARDDPPQPEKKRKARDPATISKVVLNCVIILRMVGGDVVYEKEIRSTLGNNPDTSKALRLMVNQGKLVRTGQGGRGNPFAYRCTPLGLATLDKIEAAGTPGAESHANPNPQQRAAAVAVEQAAEPLAVVS